MTAVPHSTFVAAFPPDAEFDRPAGAGFARALERGLRDRGFTVTEFDNWRDCGWVVHASIGDRRFEVHFSEYGEANPPVWLLAAAPLDKPGALARLFGRKPAAVDAELQSLASALHELLSAHPAVSNVRWAVGGPPQGPDSCASPRELEW